VDTNDDDDDDDDGKSEVISIPTTASTTDTLEEMPLERLSFENLDSLVEETAAAVQERDNVKAAELIERWLSLHTTWFENCTQRNCQDLDQRVKAMLIACNSVHDLLPCLEPRLAPYNYLEPLFEADGGTTSNYTPQQLWCTARQVIQLSAQSLQAFHHYHHLLQGVEGTKSKRDKDDDENAIAPAHLVRLSREIPQRTQALFERFQSALEGNSSIVTDNNDNMPMEEPLQTALNHVLTSWAYSQEHARGSRAEALFRVQNETAQTAETHQIVMRAWCHSRDKNFAFEATRHLNVIQDLYRTKAERYVYQKMPSRRKLPPPPPPPSTESVEGEEEPEELEEKVVTPIPSDPTRQDKLALIASNPELMAMEPSLEDYHMVLRACTLDESSRSAGRAIGVVKGMAKLINSNISNVTPDTTCFRYVLQSCALKPFQKPTFVVPALKEMWRDMEERWLAFPDYECFAAVIRCWRHVAFHPDNEASDEMRDNSVRQAMELLEDAKVLGKRRAVSEDTKPLSVTAYNDVLELLSIWSASGERRAESMQDILHEMETSDEAPSPNPKSYVHAVNIWKSVLPLSTSYHEPLAKAKATLWRMIDHLEPAELSRQGNLRKRGVRQKHRNKAAMVEHNTLNDLDDPGNPLDVLNTYIDMCSSTSQYMKDKEKEGIVVFREALSSVESFRRRKIQPNWATYSALFGCIKKLMPRGEQRSTIVQQVFALACTDGMVEDEVLKSLMEVVSADQYRDLVSSKSVDVEGIRMVPEEWTRVALGGRVVSVDGRKTRPLSVSGELKVTMAMKEFKMRSLRDKRNQKLLRGGRWVE